jgi:hypothetical protein
VPEGKEFLAEVTASQELADHWARCPVRAGLSPSPRSLLPEAIAGKAA